MKKTTFWENHITGAWLMALFIGMLFLTTAIGPIQTRIAPEYSSIYDAILYEPDTVLYDGFQNRVISCILAYNHRIKNAAKAPNRVQLRVRKWNINDILWYYVPGDAFLDGDGDLVEAVTYFDQYYDKPLVIYVAGHYIKTYEVVGHELLHVITDHIQHESDAFKFCGVG